MIIADTVAIVFREGKAGLMREGSVAGECVHHRQGGDGWKATPK
jgi:hypothetical protein